MSKLLYPPTPRQRPLDVVTDLKRLAAFPPPSGLLMSHGLPGSLTVLAQEPGIIRYLAEIPRPEDWVRIAEADTDDLMDRLNSWRERGVVLLERDRMVSEDFIAALSGDKSAHDRLDAAEVEGGHGEELLAYAVGALRNGDPAVVVRAAAWYRDLDAVQMRSALLDLRLEAFRRLDYYAEDVGLAASAVPDSLDDNNGPTYG